MRHRRAPEGWIVPTQLQQPSEDRSKRCSGSRLITISDTDLLGLVLVAVDAETMESPRRSPATAARDGLLSPVTERGCEMVVGHDVTALSAKIGEQSQRMISRSTLIRGAAGSGTATVSVPTTTFSQTAARLV